VGLGRDAASSEAYIQRLQSEFGIVDDLLRPSYQTLAVATRDSAEAQRLLNLSLDISASTGKDLGSVTAALSKAYLGNNTSLSKLGVGISKADLKAKSFDDITKELATTFAGSATAAAGTFQGSIDKLGVASANVKEIIGTGLIDALKNLGEDKSIADLASNMEDTATYLADVIRGVGVLSAKLKDIPVLGNLNVGMIPIVGSYIELLRKAGTQTAELTSADNAHLKSLQDSFKVIKKTSDVSKKLTADELKKLQAAKLKLAIDKANLLLGKDADVFDIDKIQNAAALINQAELLGKATTATQILQITNDTARLNVKKAISDLEDSIASKDEASIIAATKKLNQELGILNALGQQNIKLLDIKTVLDSLRQKDLINLANLNAAIGLLTRIGTMGIAGSTTTSITTDAAAQATAIIAAKTEAEKKAAEAAKVAAEAAKAALDAANADAASAAAKAKAAADAALAAAEALTAEEKARAEAAAAVSAAEIAKLEAATRAAEEYAAALQEAADAAAAAADAASVAGSSTTDTSSAAAAAAIAAASSVITGNGGAMGGSANAGAYASSGFPGSDKGYNTSSTNITVNTGVGDPNAIAEAIANVLREAQQRGTLLAIA
jgi:hypothetical protein